MGHQGYVSGESDSWKGAVASAALGNSVESTSYGDTYGTNGITLPSATLSGSTSAALDPQGLLVAHGAVSYPRIVTAMQLLEESDAESCIFCGPPSECGESGQAELKSLMAYGIITGSVDDERGDRGGGGSRDRREGGRRKRAGGAGDDGAQGRESAERRRGGPSSVCGESTASLAETIGGMDAVSRRVQDLIQPVGDTSGENQKFVCVFQIGLEDDDEFCLVKRILGKAGNNMRRIAEDFNAKVRLRGIGSGFLEGANGREANMPLQLNVSCTDYESYKGAVDRVAGLLNDLYKHYRRYIRSKNMEPPEVKINLEEVRRDDLSIDLLSQKAQRSASQRERDRRERERERQRLKEEERERLRKAAEKSGKEYVEPPDHKDQRASRRERSDDSVGSRFLLPGGEPVPTTPAGRRAAARAGGAAAAAVVSAAAREAERTERARAREEKERERAKEREERERRRREQAEREARAGRNAARGNRQGDSSWYAGVVPTSKGKGKSSASASGSAAYKSKGSHPASPGPQSPDAWENAAAWKGGDSGKGKRRT